VSGLAASCFAQAVSISAATSALRASLVFIDRYPEEKQEWCENNTNEFFRSASPVGIATANSIDSPGDLKQSNEWCRPITASNPGAFVFGEQRKRGHSAAAGQYGKPWSNGSRSAGERPARTLPARWRRPRADLK
jgi:type II secretory pathway pseudopilin PulG